MNALEETVKHIRIYGVHTVHFLTFNILSAYLKVDSAYISVD
jgi:hypothetical protein